MPLSADFDGEKDEILTRTKQIMTRAVRSVKHNMRDIFCLRFMMNRLPLLRVFMLVNRYQDGLRALASMFIAPNYSAHGFSSALHLTINRTNASGQASPSPLDEAVDAAELYYDKQLLDDGRSDARPMNRADRIVHFELHLSGKGNPATHLRSVELHLLLPGDLEAFSLAKLETVFPQRDMTHVEDALWIIAGSETQRSADWNFLRHKTGETGDATNLPTTYMTDVDHRMRSFIDLVCTRPDKYLKSIVVSISGFEWAFLNAESPQDTFSGGHGPMAHAFDKSMVTKIQRALVRGSRNFESMLTTIMHWEHRQRINSMNSWTALQPISANGFFNDDGHPNIDRWTGGPIQSLMGAIATRDGKAEQAYPFPKKESDLPHWFPYLTADPLIIMSIGHVEQSLGCKPEALLEQQDSSLFA